MPGPLLERTKAHRPGRSAIPFPIDPHPKRQENLRKPDEKRLNADVDDVDKASPRFMAGTTSSSSRSVTPTTKSHKRAPTPHTLLALSFGAKRGDRRRIEDENESGNQKVGQKAASTGAGVDSPLTTRECSSTSSTPISPQDKPLPGLPLAQMVTTSPSKESRTLIDAMERPLHVSIGTPDEKEWPVLYPSQPSTPHALQTFAQLHSVDSIAPSDEMVESQDQGRMTIKLLPPDGPSVISPGEGIENQANESRNGHYPQTLTIQPSASDENRPTTSQSDTTVKSFTHSKAKLIDIPPRHLSPEQNRKAMHAVKSPNGFIPRFVGAVPQSRIQHPFRKDPPQSTKPPQYELNSTRKKSSIPVPTRSPSAASAPVAHAASASMEPAVPDPSPLDYSLSIIEDEDTICMDDEPGASTLMRRGPQRRPTYSGSGRDFQAYSAISESMDAPHENFSASHDSEKLGKNDSSPLTSHEAPTPPIPSRAPSHKGSVVPRRTSLRRESSIFTEHLAVSDCPSHRKQDVDSVTAKGCVFAPNDNHLDRPSPSSDDDQPKDTASKLQDHTSALARLEGSATELIQSTDVDGAAAMVKKFTDKKRSSTQPADLDGAAGIVKKLTGKKRSSVQSVRSSMVKINQGATGRPISSNLSEKAPRSSNGHYIGKDVRHRASVPSTASSRPTVPAKDPFPSCRRPSNQKQRQIVTTPHGRDNTQIMQSVRTPQGLAHGICHDPSSFPQSKTIHANDHNSSLCTLTESPTTSFPNRHKSTTRSKLATGFRGLFHKKSADLKGAGKKRTDGQMTPTSSSVPEMPSNTLATHPKKRISNLRPKRTPSHLAEKALPEHPPEAAEKSFESGKAEMLDATNIAMKFVNLAHEETDSPRRAQMLAAATALITAVECMKKANISREQAEQAAREAAMHQEMAHESLVTINRTLGSDGGVATTTTTTTMSAGALSRSDSTLRNALTSLRTASIRKSRQTHKTLSWLGICERHLSHGFDED
ncbi:hypothetical protein IWZ03DRAFT_413203 [Phyllosticta citriasiana]|uniref:Uncharacterized protein n=1 Tax=Phyllosticta citriasiana TaxID=595635 RepID=A0ABR1KTX4_9PEZI